MLKKISVLCLACAAVALAVTACGGGGNAAVDKMFGHYDAMIKILKDNKADPDKAFQALNEYQEANKAEIDKLDQELKDFAEKNPLAAVASMTRYAEKMAELAQVSAELTANIKVDGN